MKPSKEYLEKLAQLAIKDGERKIESARQAGAQSDYGGGQMVSEANYFLMGMRGEVPPHWRRYEVQLQDPEFQKYLELKKKFE